jgi:uncharacterized protein (TIGR02452 family)
VRSTQHRIITAWDEQCNTPNFSLTAHEFIPFLETRVQVTNETTLGASRCLVESGLKPLALNFANGVHPRGGFLSGARAQEEVLCRSSALYQTLAGDPMYLAHSRRPRPDSTDWAIYSPDVPVFRADDGSELWHPWLLSFLTCAALYAPAIGQPKSGDLLRRRIHRVLAIARAFGHATLVLGAWGCGASPMIPTVLPLTSGVHWRTNSADRFPTSSLRSQTGPGREGFSGLSAMCLPQRMDE